MSSSLGSLSSSALMILSAPNVSISISAFVPSFSSCSAAFVEPRFTMLSKYNFFSAR